MELLDVLNWRYAVKKFDSTKKLSLEQVNDIEELLRLTPSSYGLQPWKFIVISDQKLKEELRPHSWDQSQITDCSHLVVMCRLNTIDESHIDKYIALAAEAKGVTPADLEGYKKMMVGGLLGRERPCYLRNWANKQVYLALGALLTSAAVMGIDTCPMEGFSADEYNKILELEEKGLSAVVVCALGYRSEEDKYADMPKVRFEKGEVVEEV